MMRRIAQFVAVALVAAAISAASLEAAQQLVVPRNSVGTAQIRNGSIQPADLGRQTVAWLNASAPTPRGRGVTVANGGNGERVRVIAANVTRGEVLGQIEYLGGLSCPNLGPYLEADATFFDANGVVVATGSEVETRPVSGVRYPLRIFGREGAVRAEVVASVTCI
jgi:hypothetical protein